MKIAVFSSHPYEKPFLLAANDNQHQLTFFGEMLREETIKLACGFDGVCCFVTDALTKAVLNELAKQGIQLVALRTAGFDYVDQAAAKILNLPVVRVPSYSPEAIAEFTIAMLLSLSRKLLAAHDKVRRHDFSLDSQIGFNLHQKTIGLIGTGQIGSQVAKRLLAFGCNVLAYDIEPSDACRELGVQYVELDKLYQQSNVISLHCPLTESSKYLLNREAFAMMQQNPIVINTGRGGLIDTEALIDALNTSRIRAAGLDVYEREQNLFFVDHSEEAATDELFLRLQACQNVLITGHQAYLTEEALTNIAKTTIDNLNAFEKGNLINQVQ